LVLVPLLPQQRILPSAFLTPQACEPPALTLEKAMPPGGEAWLLALAPQQVRVSSALIAQAKELTVVLKMVLVPVPPVSTARKRLPKGAGSPAASNFLSGLRPVMREIAVAGNAWLSASESVP
jgi:hypothetical protein